MNLDRRLVQLAVQEILLDYARLLQDKSKASSKASADTTSPTMVPYHNGAQSAFAQSASLLLDAANWESLEDLVTRALEKAEALPKRTCKMKPDYLNGVECTLESPHLGLCRNLTGSREAAIQAHAEDIVHAQWTIHATEKRVLELLQTIEAENILLKKTEYKHSDKVLWSAYLVCFEAKLGKTIKLVRTCLGIDETDKSPLDSNTEWCSGWNHIKTPPHWWNGSW